MTLQPTFALTPRSSYFFSASDYRAQISVHGVTFWPKYSESHRFSFDHQHAQDEVHFTTWTAVDPSVDYSDYQNRRWVPRVELYFDLTSFGTQKELALVFGFDALSESRLLIFSYAAQLGDETLAVGDNQFLVEIESLETSLSLYFIHAQTADFGTAGGIWFFKGVTGYVV